MGLSFHYEFRAPGETPAAELEGFLKRVEVLARSMGFNPTIVLNVAFDTEERRQFSRRLGGSFSVEDERLKGVVLSAPNQIRYHDSVSGYCRLIPQRGVVLVVTDECGCETCFGFFKFPSEIVDVHGRTITPTGTQGAWVFRDFADSPDPRYRKIVGMFEELGYVNRVEDEFAAR